MYGAWQNSQNTLLALGLPQIAQNKNLKTSDWLEPLLDYNGKRYLWDELYYFIVRKFISLAPCILSEGMLGAEIILKYF